MVSLTVDAFRQTDLKLQLIKKNGQVCDVPSGLTSQHYIREFKLSLMIVSEITKKTALENYHIYGIFLHL
jgi:hypothetical protein